MLKFFMCLIIFLFHLFYIYLTFSIFIHEVYLSSLISCWLGILKKTSFCLRGQLNKYKVDKLRLFLNFVLFKCIFSSDVICRTFLNFLLNFSMDFRKNEKFVSSPELTLENVQQNVILLKACQKKLFSSHDISILSTTTVKMWFTACPALKE